MKPLFAVMLMLLSFSYAIAQKALFIPVDEHDRRPLLIVNGKMVDALSFMALDREQFTDFKILTTEQAQKKYGTDAGKFGAVQITLNKTAQLFNWEQAAQRYYFIPKLLPAQARLFYDYFGGLQFRDWHSFVASPNKLSGIGVYLKHHDTGLPMVTIGVTYATERIQAKATKTPLKTTSFDADIERVQRIFNVESEQRVAIENAKPRIEG